MREQLRRGFGDHQRLETGGDDRAGARRVKGSEVKQHRVQIDDPRLARIVKRCQDIPGQELFQYLDDDGTRRDVGSADVNAYLTEIAGNDFTAKDFRTWAGTMLAARELGDLGAPRTLTQARRNVNEALDVVAHRLGNTRAVCRKYYVHPVLVHAYLAGRTAALPSQHGPRLFRGQRGPPALRRDEIAVLQFLQEEAAQTRH